MTAATPSQALPGASDAGLPAVACLGLALIGYGEVGRIFGRGFVPQRPASVRAYDRLFDDLHRGDESRQRPRDDGVEASRSPGDAVAAADLVVCAVTASQTLAAAKSIASSLRPGAYYVDVNSASPKTKCDCAALVNGHGGRYVEMAVMTSVPPYGIGVPMLAGGPHAAAAAPLLAALGFKVELAASDYGVASAIKMCRSVIVKGMEAIVIESFTSARRYGVEAQVLASLAETFPGLDWEKTGDYFFQRVIQHGRRRAEEMREAAVTVSEAGLEPTMASAIAVRQAWIADLAQLGCFGPAGGRAAWRANADCIPRADSFAAEPIDGERTDPR